MADAFGELLKDLRTKSAKSQDELAAACGVPVTSLRNWEQGRRRPDLGTAYRLAEALGVALEVLGKSADQHPLRGKAAAAKPASRKVGVEPNKTGRHTKQK